VLNLTYGTLAEAAQYELISVIYKRLLPMTVIQLGLPETGRFQEAPISIICYVMQLWL